MKRRDSFRPRESMACVACFVTAGSREEAARIGDALVRERLAACANVVGPVASMYWWKGKVERDREVLLILKTRKDLVKRLASRVRELHSYKVPEVIAIPIVGGNPAYLEWIDRSVGRRARSPRRPPGPRKR